MSSGPEPSRVPEVGDGCRDGPAAAGQGAVPPFPSMGFSPAQPPSGHGETAVGWLWARESGVAALGEIQAPRTPWQSLSVAPFLPRALSTPLTTLHQAAGDKRCLREGCLVL